MKIIINSGGKNSGPYTWQQVRELLLAGSISGNDFAWFDDGNEWMSVSEAMAKFKPPVSLTARISRSAPAQDSRRQTNLLQLRSRRSASLIRPLY